MTHTKLESPPTGNRNLLAAFALAAIAFACFSAGTSRVYAQEQKQKVIYFLSGLRDHASPTVGGRHEVVKDLLVLQDCINQASNIKGVKIVTKFIEARSNLDVEDIKDADALIVECSSSSSTPKRTHPLFPPLPPAAAPPPAATAQGDNPAPRDGAAPAGRAARGGQGQPPQRRYDQATLNYLDQLDQLHKAGMGIMILHWGIHVNNEQNPKARDYYLNWFGETALEGYTQNPLGYWIVTPIENSRKHPILRGVNRWIYKDEIFSRLVGNPGDPYRTELLIGESPETNQSEAGSPRGVIGPRGIASAYEKGKARGILWGGMDFHSALLNENYLRFVLNAITWTAGIDVPAGGVKTTAKYLQLTTLNHTYETTKRPEGFVELEAVPLPDTK